MGSTEKIGDFIALDWYDGPLLEVARVEFPPDADDPCGTLYAQFQSIGFWIENPDGTTPELERWARVSLRMAREDLQRAIDILDGKQVTDWHGDLYNPDGTKVT